MHGKKDSLTKPTHFRDNTYIVIDSADRVAFSSTQPNDYVVKLPVTMRNVDTIELMSFQLTRTENNVNSGNNTFVVGVGGTNYTVTIPLGEISGGANLATAVQTAIRTATGDTGFVVAFDAVTNRLTITNTVAYTVNVGELVAKLLGFIGDGSKGAGNCAVVNVSGTYTLSGRRAIDLRGVPYVILAINDYERIVSPSNTLQKAFLTVPMESRNVGDRFVICNDEKEKKGLYILSNNQINMYEFRVRLLRPDGTLYDTNGVDHTLVFRLFRNNWKDYND